MHSPSYPPTSVRGVRNLESITAIEEKLCMEKYCLAARLHSCFIPPSRACVYQHTRIASAVSRNSGLQIKALPQSVCSACPGWRTSEQSLHSHKDFRASLLAEIGGFPVAMTWTCSWEKPHQKSLLCCTVAFWSEESRGQNTRSEKSRHARPLAVPVAG